MPHSPRSIDSIVAEQVERWRLERARANRPDARPAPVVVVSRQYGAQGAAVARVVADRLGFSYWNRELVDEVARSAHTSGAMVGVVDEHHHDAILATVRDLTARTLGQSEYFRELVGVVRSITAHGSAVLVGRGIGFMLQPTSMLSVRVVCPLADRVAGLVERRQLDEAAARAEITAADAERHAFVRDHLFRDVEDPAAYHLHVNTGVMTIEQAADVIVAAYRIRFGDAGARATR